MSEKLQKVLARVGLGSRRAMEEIITAGRVSINGKIATLGDRIESHDELRVDGRKIHFEQTRHLRRRVIIYYKPEGEICSRHDPQGRPTVFEHLPTISQDRWVMVGRLDINSSGLLLFTNDGELANRLMHPSHGIERQYAVRVLGEVTQPIRQTLLKGVELADGFAKFESFSDLGGEGINRWYQVIVKEGRNREVRRLFESQGFKVSRLLRTRYGIINLPRELRTGRWLELDQLAIDQLAQSVQLPTRETVSFNEHEQRRINKMLDNPMKARRIDRYRHVGSLESRQDKPLTRYSPTGRYLGHQDNANKQHKRSLNQHSQKSESYHSGSTGQKTTQRTNRSSESFRSRQHSTDQSLQNTDYQTRTRRRQSQQTSTPKGRDYSSQKPKFKK